MEFSIQSPAVFAVVRSSTRAAVKEFVLAPLQVLLAPLALGGTLALLCRHTLALLSSLLLTLSVTVPTLVKGTQGKSIPGCQGDAEYDM